MPEKTTRQRILDHLAGVDMPCEATNIGMVVGGLRTMRKAESWARKECKALVEDKLVRRTGGAYEITDEGRAI